MGTRLIGMAGGLYRVCAVEGAIRERHLKEIPLHGLAQLRQAQLRASVTSLLHTLPSQLICAEGCTGATFHDAFSTKTSTISSADSCLGSNSPVGLTERP